MARIRPIAALVAGLLMAGAGVLGATSAWADDDSTPAETASCVASPVAGPITEPTVTMKCTDGSYEISNPDGSLERHDAAGCVSVTDADGNVTYRDETGAPSDCVLTSLDGTPWVDATGTWCQDVLDDEGNKIDEVCAMPDECIGEACAIAYSTFGGRDDCMNCRSLGAPEAKAASADDSAATKTAAADIESAATALAASETDSDKSAAIDAAAVDVNLAAATAAPGQSVPVAPIAATVAGGGLIAAGFTAWRRLAARGL